MLDHTPEGVELLPHQEEAVKKLGNGKILHGGTGVGKSITAIAYYMEEEQPRDIIVITTAKKRDDLDWEEEAVKFGISRIPEFSSGGSITVDSWNNIKKYEDTRGAFFIFDEQRLVGSGAWTKTFIKIAKHNRWILLTATPGDNWLDYIPVFIANGFYKNRTEFLNKHVVFQPFSKYPKVQRYNSVGTLVRLRNQLLVSMPYERKTTRDVQYVEVDYDRDLMKKVVNDRWHVYEERPLRNTAELFIVMRKVVNSHPTRAEKLSELLSRHPKLIVFYNFDYELDSLRSLASSLKQSSDTPSSTGSGSGSFEWAEWNGHKHEPIPKSDRWLYLVQYTAGSEGWNCIETDAMAFHSLTYSYKAFHQAHGRTDRLNTPFRTLKYYVFLSNSAIDRAILKALSEKKSFNEGDFEVDVLGEDG